MDVFVAGLLSGGPNRVPKSGHTTELILPPGLTLARLGTGSWFGIPGTVAGWYGVVGVPWWVEGRWVPGRGRGGYLGG